MTIFQRSLIFLFLKDAGFFFPHFLSRLNFSTAYSSNAVSICISIGLTKVTRLEVSTRYLIHWEQDGLAISPGVEEEVCEYICCMLTTIETEKSLLSKE